MKYIYLILLSITTTHLFSQSLTIKRTIDKMDDSEYFEASKSLKLVGASNKWFVIEPMLAKNDSNKIECRGLYIRFSGIGSCNDNDVMDFLFMDGSKLKIKAFNEFHCKGTSAFIVSNVFSESLQSISALNKPIKSIRFTNGRTFDNLTVDVPAKDKKYFIELQSAINTQRVN